MIKRLVTTYDADQQVIKTVDYDDTAGTVTTTVTGEAPVVEPIDPEVLADIQADEREQRQLDRLDTKLDALKLYVKPERLTVSEYRIDTALDPMVDVRELARRCNDQENMIQDLQASVKVLIRLVRGLAAEDDA